MKTTHKLLSYVIIFIGVVHIMLAVKLYDELDFNALWFVSGGLMAIFLGFINVLMNEAPGPSSGKAIWVLSNVLGTVFIISAVLTLGDIKYIVIASVMVPLLMLSLLLNYSRN
jgi:hypothetical protein